MWFTSFGVVAGWWLPLLAIERILLAADCFVNRLFGRDRVRLFDAPASVYPDLGGCGVGDEVLCIVCYKNIDNLLITNLKQDL